MSEMTEKPVVIPGSTYGVGGVDDIVVRSLTIPLHSVALMLPATAVAEVAVTVNPNIETDRQPWYLGTVMWRGLNLPLISYNVILGKPEGELLQNSRITVINGIMNNEQLPFYCILAEGIPRLLQAQKSVMTINASAADDENDKFVASRVYVGEQEYYIPELENIEKLLISVGGKVR